MILKFHSASLEDEPDELGAGAHLEVGQLHLGGHLSVGGVDDDEDLM